MCPLAAWIACGREWEGSGSRASASARRSKSGPPASEGQIPLGGDILGFAGYGRGVEPRAPGRTTRARVSPRGGWPAHLLSRANVRRHAVPVERRETRCCARSFLSQLQKLRAKSRVDPRRASQRLLPLRADIILWWHVDAVARPGRPFAMGFMDLFKKKDPKEMVRKWQSKLRSEMRGVDRQIRGEPPRVPKRLLNLTPRRHPRPSPRPDPASPVPSLLSRQISRGRRRMCPSPSRTAPSATTFAA